MRESPGIKPVKIDSSVTVLWIFSSTSEDRYEFTCGADEEMHAKGIMLYYALMSYV